MKKRILFIAMLFIALTGSYKDETRAAGNLDVTKQVSIKEKPRIVSSDPTSGKVTGNVGRTIFFSVKFAGTPTFTFERKREKVILYESQRMLFFTDTDENVTGIMIHDARIEDSGEYIIRIKNDVGYIDAAFIVKITD